MKLKNDALKIEKYVTGERGSWEARDFLEMAAKWRQA